MQWSKVKTILIFILLVVDSFLLIHLLGGYYAEYRREMAKNEDFLTVLSNKGVGADAMFTLPKAVSLPTLEVDRSKNDEDAFTRGLLGEGMERTEAVDGGTSYDSARGHIEWSAEGKIEGAFVPESYQRPTSEREMRVMLAKILEGCGISSAVRIEADADEMSASASFYTAGAPVFNRSLRFTFDEENVAVSGWWTFQTPYMVRTNNYVLCEPTDAVLALLDAETSIRSVTSAEIGYVLMTGSGRQTSIVPCCRIITDRGEFFVDSLKNVVISV